MSKLGEKTEVSMDIRTIIGIIMVIVSIAGTYFTLDAQVKSNRVEIHRIKEYTDLNNEFRIKWPRGEMGALPDDAEQNLRLTYIEKQIEEQRKILRTLEQQLIEMKASK
jgi:hypothetical protein